MKPALPQFIKDIKHEEQVIILESVPERAGRSLAAGFVVGVTNPKTIVFFLAFLPQFTSSSGPAFPQLALLGLVFGLMAAASDSTWALVAGSAVFKGGTMESYKTNIDGIRHAAAQARGEMV